MAQSIASNTDRSSTQVKRATDLSREQLVALVEKVQQALFLEGIEGDDDRVRFVFDADKEWDSETLNEIGEAIAEAGLRPEGDPAPFEPLEQ